MPAAPSPPVGTDDAADRTGAVGTGVVAGGGTGDAPDAAEPGCASVVV